jgi:hypothetical protein
LKKILFIALLLPLAASAQISHLRILNNERYAWLKGNSLDDTVISVDQNSKFDLFGTIRIRGFSLSSDTSTYKPGGYDANGNFVKMNYWPGSGGGGITSLNSLTGGTQTFATGTSGTDFAINSTGTTHTFNIPTASSSNRGLLSTTDWSTFNNKLSNITGLVSQGTNVTITGTGTGGDPYVINSTGGGGGGDFSSNTSTSVDNEIVLFSGTGGKTGKRATQTGLLLGTSGVISAVTTSAGISGAISDETGTGVAVFGTAPTLTAATMAGNLTNNSAGAYDIGATGSRFRYIFANGLNLNSSSAGAANTINAIQGFTITNGGTPTAGNIFTFSTAGSTITSGTQTFVLWGTSGFTPTSGTGIFNQHRFAHTINQTGGASGITRTLFIDPTITAAADYRAIETTQGKIGFGLLPDVTTADSILAYENGFVGKKAVTAITASLEPIEITTTATTTTGGASQNVDITLNTNLHGEIELYVVGVGGTTNGSYHYRTFVYFAGNGGSNAPTVNSTTLQGGPLSLEGIGGTPSAGITGISSPVQGVRITLNASSTEDVAWKVHYKIRSHTFPL